ncbi:MAG: 50S ribosomal protein L24 [Bdellovibrionia bacterium]
MIQVERRKFSLRKNDQVMVIAGKEKGKTGKILKINSKSGRVTVEGLNTGKRHTRPTQAQAGGIVEKELPLDYSNVLLLCPKCNQGVRHKTVVSGSGDQRKKSRVCKRCDLNLDLT